MPHLLPPIAEVYRRIRGNRMVEIRFVEQMDLELSIVRSCPHTRDVVVEDHPCLVELETDDSEVALLLHPLTTLGVQDDAWRLRQLLWHAFGVGAENQAGQVERPRA